MSALREGARRLSVRAAGKSTTLHPDDVIALSTFVRSSESFRRNTQSFSPVCLPKFDADAFVYAYVADLEPCAAGMAARGGDGTADGDGDGTADGDGDGEGEGETSECRLCLVLVSTADDAFHALAAARVKAEARLREEGAIADVMTRAEGPGPGPGLDGGDGDGGGAGAGSIAISRHLPKDAGGGLPGETPLLHFLYHRPPLGQFVAPTWEGVFADDARARKKVIRRFARVRASAIADDADAWEYDDGGGSGGGGGGGGGGGRLVRRLVRRRRRR